MCCSEAPAADEERAGCQGGFGLSLEEEAEEEAGRVGDGLRGGAGLGRHL